MFEVRTLWGRILLQVVVTLLVLPFLFPLVAMVQGSLAGFVARQAWLLKPRRVVLSHHDDWLPGFSVHTEIEPIAEELDRWLPGAELARLGYLDGYTVFAGL